MNEEIEKLIFRAIDGAISQDEFNHLQDVLEANEDARVFYTKMLSLDQSVSDIAESARSEAVDRPEVHWNSLAGVDSETDSSLRGHLLTYISIAASAVVLTTLAFYFTRPWSGPEIVRMREVQVAPLSSEKNGVAEVVQRIDCVLENEKWSTVNSSFEAGQSIVLLEGVVVVEFRKGARVTVEGPANLEFLSDNSGFLQSGKLTAVIPDSAIGFEILTPSGRLIDHGTEFGVSVDPNGDTETHVFKGEVELIANHAKAQELDPNSGSQREFGSQRLTDAMGLRVKREGDVAAEVIEANPSQFIRTSIVDRQRVKNRTEITELVDEEHLTMWFEAGQGVQRDSKGRVISWENLAQSQADRANQELESSAWQVNADRRPGWSENSLGGRPAIQFGGFERKEFLATTPLRLKADATALIVCQFDPLEEVGYGHLLVLGGQTKFVLERREKSEAGSYTWSWQNKNVPPFRMEALKNVKPTTSHEPQICAVRYSVEQDIFELSVNGEAVAEGDPIGSLAVTSSQIIGCGHHRNRFFFKGQIAEIVVYDRALNQEKFNQVTESLMQKYRIQAR
jgi:hypothetical protein